MWLCSAILLFLLCSLQCCLQNYTFWRGPCSYLPCVLEIHTTNILNWNGLHVILLKNGRQMQRKPGHFHVPGPLTCVTWKTHFHIFIPYCFMCHLRLVKDSSLTLKLDMCLRQTSRRLAWWGDEYRDESVSTATVGTKTRTLYKSVHAWQVVGP